MRSQVTRHVLRRPSTARGISSWSVASAGPRPSHASAARPIVHHRPLACQDTVIVQRRSFFKLFQKPPRMLKELEVEPGYETLLAYKAAANDDLRPPPLADLVKAWRDFFGYKAKHHRVVNSTQSLCALGLLEYFCRPENMAEAGLTIDDLYQAMQCLERRPRDGPTNHLELSQALFKEIRRRELGLEPGSLDGAMLGDGMKEFFGHSNYVHSLLVALSSYGRALEAKDIFLRTLWGPTPPGVEFHPRHSLLPVIDGLAKEGHEPELRSVLKEAIAAGVRYDPTIQSVMTTFFAKRNDFEQTKWWLSRPLHSGRHPRPETYYEVLQFALRNDKKEWALEIYQQILAHIEDETFSNPKMFFDVCFQYAYLLLDKGIDHIEHMVGVAMRRYQNKPKALPNIGSINCLVKCAVDKGDAYMAERFVTLAEKLGFPPDMTTYILQLEYRIAAGDMEGAFSAFHGLRNLDTASRDREVPVLNKYIRQICASFRPDYERILEVTSYLEQRHVTLEPETVVSMCLAFLKNDETYEVIDTLALHTAHYSISERQMVRKSFVEYCLDSKNSTARVWDAYALLRQFFPELEREDRVAIMDAFFDRRRADMACHVFGHMRSHENMLCRPTVDTYVRCFEGLGRCPDMESLSMIHNMAKMDTNIQPETRLYNGFMIGYIACDEASRALDFWREISTSPEGPSYASLEIAFRAYQVKPYGDVPARELWGKILNFDIDVPEHVYAAYLTALAAHSHLSEVKALLEDSRTYIGKRADYLTFAYIYNALPSKDMKGDFEKWANHEFQPLWKALNEKYRRSRDGDGMWQFKMITMPWKA